MAIPRAVNEATNRAINNRERSCIVATWLAQSTTIARVDKMTCVGMVALSLIFVCTNNGGNVLIFIQYNDYCPMTHDILLYDQSMINGGKPWIFIFHV